MTGRMDVPEVATSSASRRQTPPRDLKGADPAALRAVSRMACALAEDHSEILGPLLTNDLRALRKDIEDQTGEVSRPQDSPNGIHMLKDSDRARRRRKQKPGTAEGIPG